MAIVFVNRYFAPDHAATAQMMSDLAFHAAGAGRRVSVVTGRQRLDDPRARLPSRERLHGLDVHRVWSTRFGRDGLAGRAVDYLSFHVGAVLVLLAVLRRGDTVVAGTDPPLLGIGAAVAARLRGAKLVNWLHDVFPEVAIALRVGGAAPLGRAARMLVAGLRWPRDRSLRAAEVNVVLGERMARHVASRGVAPGRIEVIHNWSDGDAVSPRPTRESPLRRELGLEGKFVVGYAGNLGRAHDLSSLPAAARRLADLPDLVFLVIGAGAGHRPLRSAVERAGLGNVVFAPYQPRSRLGDSLAAADVHLVSLRPELEGLVVPSKIYGVLAAGRCCVHVGDPAGEVGRILADGRCGIVVEPHDAAGLEAAIRNLHEDEALRDAMGARARALFVRRFARCDAMARWMRLLR